MLEWIREYLMRRLQENRERASKKWKGTLCPKIKKLLQKHVDKIGDCIPVKANDRHYQISCYDGSQFSVDLERRTCTCRLWQLSGIPCKHACSAIFNQNLQPEEMVHPYYNVDTYKTVYEPTILPINGEMLWTETGFIPPLPPNFGRSPGRPARARNREPDELKDKASKKKLKKRFKLKRQHVKHHCKICGEEGHNAKGCALYKDMQEPGLDEIVMDRLFSDQTRKVTMPATDSGVNDQPPILPPIVEEHEPMQHDITPHILTEPGPTPTPPCVQGPTMYDQLRMAHTNVSFQPQVTLQPRINIRAPPPMTGTSFMPCFSSKPAIPVSKTVVKEGGRKWVDISKWPSQNSEDHLQK
ncbi:UNVERIFIED_CONTAM: hypothetical protein Sradi_0215300 [Sesamum radiatum]|uniref:SWIM-type domain-containing protein n=1 Tax=Sesamum radiatum TaxID=300843 RepID=A0AAW2W1F7_SESRA